MSIATRFFYWWGRRSGGAAGTPSTPTQPTEPTGEFDLLWADGEGITWGSTTIIDYPVIT